MIETYCDLEDFMVKLWIFRVFKMMSFYGKFIKYSNLVRLQMPNEDISLYLFNGMNCIHQKDNVMQQLIHYKTYLIRKFMAK